MNVNKQVPSNVASEICGFVLGDGNLSKRDYRVTLTGSMEDKEYYLNEVFYLLNKYFEISAKYKKIKDKHSIRSEINNKKLFLFLLSYGLKRGRKDNLGIPPIVFENRTNMISFLRGLFDTDGCIKFDKQKRSVNYYPRIRIGLKPSPLMSNLKYLLNALGFSYSFRIEDNTRGYKKEDAKLAIYELSGKKNLIRWFEVIAPKNPIHTTKYSIWKKYGFCPSRTTLDERRTILNKKIYKLSEFLSF